MNRNITGTIRKTDGAVWAGAAIEFELERSSYDESAQYPARAVRAVADEGGELSVSLWVNEDALRPSRYICTLPDGSQFRFTLPTGGGDADLNELRETAVEEDSPTQNTLVAFLPVVRTEAQQIVDQAMADLNAEIDSKAEQSSLDTTNTNVATVTSGLASANTAIAAKANQSSLDTTNANVTTVTTGLAAANTAIATKASQDDLDTTNEGVSSLWIELDTKAKQVSLDNTDANVAQIISDLDALSHEVGNKASQADLNTTNSIVGSIDSTLDATVTNLAAANAAIATKANQSALNTTNANVTILTDGLAAANVDISTRARQAALTTTNLNLSALSAVVDTKAAQSALTSAISDLEDAISAAQAALENLIEQKADLSHTHEPASIISDAPNSIGYFSDGSGELSSSDQFVFRNSMLGFGTTDPEYTLDLQQPFSSPGNQSRMIVNLNNPGPIVQLVSDPSSPTSATINFECGGMVNTIDSDTSGNLGLGTEGVTPAVIFRMLRGTFSFLGMVVGMDDPSDLIFPPLSWGFYKQTTHFGFGDAAFYLVFHDGDTLQTLPFSGK
jgi:hypothetical protein